MCVGGVSSLILPLEGRCHSLRVRDSMLSPYVCLRFSEYWRVQRRPEWESGCCPVGVETCSCMLKLISSAVIGAQIMQQRNKMATRRKRNFPALQACSMNLSIFKNYSELKILFYYVLHLSEQQCKSHQYSISHHPKMFFSTYRFI